MQKITARKARHENFVWMQGESANGAKRKADLETVAQANQRKRPHDGERDRLYFMENACVQNFHPVICLIQTEIQPSSKLKNIP